MNNRLQISVALVIFIIAVLSNIIDRFIVIYQSYLLSGVFHFSGSMKMTLKFLLINVIPSALFFSLLVYFILKPMQQAINELTKGNSIADRLLEKARKLIISMPKLLVIVNILGFSLGMTVYSLTTPVLDYYPPEYLMSLWILILFKSICVGFLEFSVVNLFLNRPRQLLKINYIESHTKTGWFNLKNKNILLTIALSGWILASIVVHSYFHLQFESQRQKAWTIISDPKILKADKHKQIETLNKHLKFYIAYNQGDEAAAMIRFPLKKSHNDMISEFFLVILIFTMQFLPQVFIIKYVFTRDFVIRIHDLDRKLHEISSGTGDLNTRINITQFDELGYVTDGFNRFSENLRKILIKVSENANHVYESANELSQSVEQASAVGEEMMASIESVGQRTGEQISMAEITSRTLRDMIQAVEKISQNVNQQSVSVEETSSSISEMAGSIQSVSHTTSNAQEIANNLVQIASQGGVFVKKSLEAIKEIDSSSQYVGEMVTVISQIAEQTNLLAMNAAIEAAHAGSAGKGFAVVADEVRKLAENSARSAGEIVSHIKVMTDQINNGVKLAEETGEAFELISQDINQTSTLITEISSAMKEQSLGTSEVLSAVGKVVETTNDIKNLAQEEKANSVSVSRSMEDLVEVSTQINQSVEEQTQGNQDIVRIVERVSDVSQINKRVVDELHRLLKQFNLGDKGMENI